jgi:uridine monophosphate synthetase
MKKRSLTYTQRIPFAKNFLTQQLFKLLDDKKTNLALSADVIHCDELLDLADKVGPEICILKTHIDILEDFTPAFPPKLLKLAQQHRFFIFEDRKFADIGNTVQQQYQGGIYRIADWADIVNAHGLPGPGIISGLIKDLTQQRGLLLLAEMSSANNLMTAEYTQSIVHMAEQFPEWVMGFISQRKLSDHPGWIYLTPGIQLIEGKDSLGQQYTTPERTIIENESDIIIVGRGILTASDPLLEAKKYRQAGWEANIFSL